MKPDFAQYGFSYPDNLIQAFFGGSQLHGAKVDGTDNTDWYGVFIEPPAKIIGLDRDEHFVFTTGGKLGGNGPRDVAMCVCIRCESGLEWLPKGIPPLCISCSRTKNSLIHHGTES